MIGAEGGSRTHTTVRSTDFKSVARVLTSFYCALPSSIYRRFSRQSTLRLAWYRHVTPSSCQSVNSNSRDLTLELTQGSILALLRKGAVEQTEFRIGELATRAGVSIDAVRYYERLKLLPRAGRTAGGFRLFGPESVERVQFIKQAQELGLTLDEIKGLLATGGAEECRRVRDLLSKKIGELDGKMTALKDFRRTLARHLSACERELETQGDSASSPLVTAPKSQPPPGKSGKNENG